MKLYEKNPSSYSSHNLIELSKDHKKSIQTWIFKSDKVLSTFSFENISNFSPSGRSPIPQIRQSVMKSPNQPFLYITIIGKSIPLTSIFVKIFLLLQQFCGRIQYFYHPPSTKSMVKLIIFLYFFKFYFCCVECHYYNPKFFYHHITLI